MLIRHLLSKIKPESSLAYPIKQAYYFHQEVGEQNQVSDPQTAQEIIKPRVKRARNPAKDILYDIQSLEEPSFVSEFLLFSPKLEITDKFYNQLKQIEDPAQRLTFFKKNFIQHRKKLDKPLLRYEKALKLNFDKLVETKMPVDMNLHLTRIVEGDKKQSEVHALRLARIGGFQYIDENIAGTMIQQQNISSLKKLYETGYFSSVVLTHSFYEIIANKTLNSSVSKGFYLNIMYESYKHEIEEELGELSIYSQLPIEKNKLRQIVEQVNNHNLYEANPVKFYWSIVNSDPKNFDKYAPFMIKELKHISVNGKKAENMVSSLCFFFVKEKAMLDIVKQIFNLNPNLDQALGIWALTLLIFSRIKTILATPQKIKSSNFSDLFNAMRQIDEGNSQLIYHYLPKTIYHFCEPQIFKAYQIGLKSYEDKGNKLVPFHYGKLEEIFNLNNTNNQGFQVIYDFPNDLLPIKYRIPSVSDSKDYHKFDKMSAKLVREASYQTHSKQMSSTFKKALKDSALLQLLPIQNHEQYLKQHISSDKDLVQIEKQRALKELQKQKKQIFFKSIDSSVTRDILQGNYKNALDYIQLLIGDTLDRDSKLKKHIKLLNKKSQDKGFAKNTTQEAIFILKQIQQKLIYRQNPNIHLTEQILQQNFQEQFQLQQNQSLQDQFIEQLNKRPELIQKFQQFQFEQQFGRQVRNIIKKKGVDKILKKGEQLIRQDQTEDMEKLNEFQEQEQNLFVTNKKKQKVQLKQKTKQDDVDNFLNSEQSLNQRKDKKKNWKNKKYPEKQKKTSGNQGGIFVKRNKKFSTTKDISDSINEKQSEASDQGYSSYLKAVKQMDSDVEERINFFNFNKCKNFAEVSTEFTNGVQKINENNILQVLSSFKNIAIIGDIKVMIKYYFLKGSSEATKNYENLLINFETSLGVIQKNYANYLQKCPFMFKLPEQLYLSLLQDQQNKFNRKQFKKIVAHYALHCQTISQEAAKTICKVCSSQKIGVTLLEILELFTIRNVKGSFECVKIFATGIQKYRNLSEDLLNFLNKYCRKFNYNIEARLFETYIQNMVQAQQYQKLNNLLEIMRQQLKEKQYKIDENLSPQENLNAEKKYKFQEAQRFLKESFQMIEMVANNLVQKTQVPLFLIELFDEYRIKKGSILNSRQLGAGLLIYSQQPEKLMNFLIKVRDSGAQNNQYVFECALRALKLFGRRLRSYVQNILQCTLYHKKIQLNEQHLLNLGEIFMKLDIANAYNEYLQYILRYQPKSNPEIKRLYYKIFNKNSDDHSKNQMSGLLDMIFNQNKAVQRLQYKKIKQQEEKKAQKLSNLNLNQQKIADGLYNNKNIRTTNNAEVWTKQDIISPQLLHANEQKIVKRSKKQNDKPENKKDKKQQASIEAKKTKTNTFQSDKFTFSRNLSKKALRNGPLKIFLDSFMKKYQKVEAEDETKKTVEKGGKTKKGDKAASKGKK